MLLKLSLCFLLVICGSIVTGRYESPCSRSRCPKRSSRCPGTSIPKGISSGNCMNYTAPEYVNNTVVQRFAEYAIVSQIIPCSPTQRLDVKLVNMNVSLGNYFNPFILGFYPYTVNWPADPQTLYSAVFLNADRNYILYGTYELLYTPLLVVNIPGNNLALGDTLVDYRPNLPITGYGPQRYIGLIYEQNEKIDVTPNFTMSFSSSDKLNLTDFVETNNLGNPVFGNFFVTSLSFCDSEKLPKIL